MTKAPTQRGVPGVPGVALCINCFALQGWDDFVGNTHLSAGLVFDGF